MTITFPLILYVALGGALGSVARFGVAVRLNDALPYGTLMVNIIGSLLMGLLAGWLLREPRDSLYALLGIGFLGGFTTFSSFALEVFRMLGNDNLLLALGYVLLSVTASILAVAAGMIIMKGLG